MTDIWGQMEKDVVEQIRRTAKRITKDQIDGMFKTQDGQVFFRIQRKVQKAMRDLLDLDATKLVEDGVEALVKALDIDFIAQELPRSEFDGIEFLDVPLIGLEDFDYEPEITDEDRSAATLIDESMSAYEVYFSSSITDAADQTTQETVADQVELPSVIDNRMNQSPVKNQGGRGTCVAHASMASLEAYLHIMDDLSEQCAHYRFNESLNRPHNQNAGLRTTDAAGILARNDGRVCEEPDWPYIPNQATINALVANGTYGPPQACQNNYQYGIESYKIITDLGLTGESIKNTRYLETLLYQGYNIVIGTWVSWNDSDNNGILDPVLDPNGNPIGRGGHAMLVVGYNRTSRYFIVKNSWGNGWGHDGYAYLSYDLVRSCFKYGFVLHRVVPAERTELPPQMAAATYSSEKISRQKLRAAILFFKTSKNRYAVCEAYAGDNLLLRNIRVFNTDGSLHRKRNSLTIRGHYFCDLDRISETKKDADFWWEAVSPGVNYLVPKNKAKVIVAFDLAALDATKIGSIQLRSEPIKSEDLNYALIVGKTTEKRLFKLLIHMKYRSRIEISYIEVFNEDGTRHEYAMNRYVPLSWTYDIDTLRKGGGSKADFWWHVISDGVGFIEKQSTAKTQLHWHLEM